MLYAMFDTMFVDRSKRVRVEVQIPVEEILRCPAKSPDFPANLHTSIISRKSTGSNPPLLTVGLIQKFKDHGTKVQLLRF